MRSIILAIAVSLLFSFCKGGAEKKQETLPDSTNIINDSMVNGQRLGDTTITASGSTSSETIYKEMENKDSAAMKIKGTITSVCQARGCWVNLKADGGKDVRVKTREEFFFDKDSKGKTAIVDGYAKWKTVTEKHRKHLAEDEGLSKEEIAKIKGDERELIFYATGAIVK